MVREKVERRGEYRYVVYDDEHWRLLGQLREEAARIMKPLREAGLAPIIHGSIARGDVHPGSDIDVLIPSIVPSYLVELALERAGLRPAYKLVVQATPQSTPKAYIVLDVEEKRVVSFPLAKLSKTEYEFYYFGGALSYEELVDGKRVPGVDKRLVLIEPTSEGHRESPVMGREAEVARIVGVSVETVLERVRVLTRRDELGRTGVFVKVELEPWESVEEAVLRIARENPLFRRALRVKGSPLI
ncbi:nucleotidyltransferase domain-containing protein [Hyperthermus butylicus]|uniref:protein adenylyltransferase n=1 Tax=Hyperthermus butylicus (strain DSM 5456 / JCM 9403 / PLM1-5) TaxID=415426 RepID=A2BL80_HYPBU|nr:nucleotidyltransferase domain-containing protein [Hyperthermus butylicus]ABM80741.1 putative nucleotidyltransferase [Hyperthermus butylicus DSM 5456]